MGLGQDIIQLKPGNAFAQAVKDGYDKWAEESMWAESAFHCSQKKWNPCCLYARRRQSTSACADECIKE